ncbi:MAG TPA: ABC transporter permease [Pyrinomonadaceae bacterium]
MTGPLLQDIRFGVRMLGKNPGVTLLAVFALALGIGANTATFSIVNAVMLRPLSVKDSANLVMLFETNPQAGIARGLVSYFNFVDWKEQSSAFSDVAAFSTQPFNLRSEAGPERISGARVSSDFFRLVGSSPALGRVFTADEDKPGNNRVVILSHNNWQRRFGSDPNIEGKTLVLDGVSYTVVGVMPPDFQFPEKKVDLWTPLAFDSRTDGSAVHNLNVVARLKPNVTIEQAQVEMDTLGRQLQEKNANGKTGWGVGVLSLSEYTVGNIKPAFVILFAAVAFVLLIACANVVNLLLARAAARQKEIAIRSALGATPFRIIRQLFTESALLSLLGGALGLLLAFFGIKLLLASLPGSVSIPRADEITIDSQVLIFTIIVSLLAGVLCGLAPALRLSKPDLNGTLKEVVKGAAGGVSNRRIRNLLIVSEVALALLLLVSAGLMVKSFVRLQEVNPGFRPDNVLTMEVSLPKAKYAESYQMAAFYRQSLEQIAALPGVHSVGVISHLPLSGENANTLFTLDGQAAQSSDELYAGYRVTSSDYFSAMSIPLKSGRAFNERDTDQAQPVVIINETMARRYWPKEDPLGKRIKRGDLHSTRPWLTVVGVVGDVRHSAVNQEPKPEMFLPYQQNPVPDMYFAVRTDANPKGIAPAARNAILSVDKDQPVSNVKSMGEVMTEANFGRRAMTVLLIIFAAVALALAIVGIYGVISYSVSQRQKEIGIRMSLGARQIDVLKLILRQGMIVVLIGVGIGLVLTVVSGSLLSSLLYGVSATDLVTLVGTSALLSLVALVACLIPARRAAKLDPMISLRCE